MMYAWISNRHDWRAFGFKPSAADRRTFLVHFGHRTLVIGQS